MLGDLVITPSQLNRRSGLFLRQAVTRPVTVRMKEADLVILRRDEAANLYQEDATLRRLERLAAYILGRFGAKSVSQPDELAWLDVFENDDLLEFFGEYRDILRAALEERAGWNDVDAVLHEWKESAFALRNKELQEAARSLAAGSELEAARAPDRS